MSGMDVKGMKMSMQQAMESFMPAKEGPHRMISVLPKMEGDWDDWSQLAGLILEADIKDGIEGLQVEIRQRREREKAIESGKELLPIQDEEISPHRHMMALAERMGTPVDDLFAIKTRIPEEVWATKKMERMVRLESVRMRLQNWSELEHLAVQALMHRIETGRIVDDTTLLTIANTAARVTQVPKVGTGVGGDVNVQINQIGATPQGDLPGPGHLGPITLTLSRRTVQQLSTDRVVSETSYLESIEMLSSNDVPDMIKTIDLEKDK